MGVVKYATGIEYVSGSMKKPTKKNGHSHGSYLIGTHRVADTENPDCTRLYIRDKGTYARVSTPTTKELVQRGRFGAVAAAVQARRKDLGKITQDLLNFEAQKNTANGKKTMKAYLWSLELAAYDQAHS